MVPAHWQVPKARTRIMPMIKIAGQDYDVDSLSDAAKAQLQALQFVETELVRLGRQTAVYQTARVGYLNALKKALQPGPNYSFDDVIKFD